MINFKNEDVVVVIHYADNAPDWTFAEISTVMLIQYALDHPDRVYTLSEFQTMANNDEYINSNSWFRFLNIDQVYGETDSRISIASVDRNPATTPVEMWLSWNREPAYGDRSLGEHLWDWNVDEEDDENEMPEDIQDAWDQIKKQIGSEPLGSKFPPVCYIRFI